MEDKQFSVIEASIQDIQTAICAGKVTCTDVVQQYIERAKKYNGPSSLLVTKDGANLPLQPGVVRAGTPIQFPLETLAASELLPNLEDYQGPPLEFGRMDSTASDHHVAQQFGMIVGKENAGQLNTLATLNIRGERSVTCKGDFDLHPSLGKLPAGAPPVCEMFRHFPDAIEQAKALDEQYGNNPPLDQLPLYGVVFSFKDAFDTKDMRSTGGGDAKYDIDFPARDHILVEQLRKKGAIIYAKATMTEYNGRAGDPGGKNLPNKVLPSVLGYQRSTWAGNPSNPYDTTRSASLGSSSGSGVSVSANLVTASLGEETRQSTRGPSNHNSVALILPHKAMLGFDGGAIGADIYCDRTGILAKSLDDCAVILDALKDPENGYYDPRDPYTTVPRSSVLPAYSPFIKKEVRDQELAGKRIGVIRESMLNPGILAVTPIIAAASQEIKDVLGKKLGATLVESRDDLWTPDSECEQMTIDFQKSLARLVPIFMPDILFRLTPSGEPVFPEFVSAIKKTEFAPGQFFGSGDLDPMDYLVLLADLNIAIPKNLTIATVQDEILANSFRFHISQYLSRRVQDWKDLGFTEKLNNWAALNERSKYWGDDQRSAFKNWEETTDPRNPLGGRQGIDERIMLRELLRRVDMMVLLENKLDVFVRLHSALPPAKIGWPDEPGVINHLRNEITFGPNAGLTEILVPAGYVRQAYDAKFQLSADKKRYVGQSVNIPTQIPYPGLPFSLVFRAEPGKEDTLLEIASAYEKASHRRVSPPNFQ
jgi:Asp-tRNA(Asn)/Glu-tRNA(Gln) amidotransferase A subunit family amidase